MKTRTKQFDIVRLLAIAGLLLIGASVAQASRRTTTTNPPTDPPVVNEDAPIVSSP